MKMLITEKKYTEIYRWFYFLCFSAGFAINTIAQPLGILLFAKEYYIAWTYVPPLVIAAVFSSMAGFLAQIFTSAKKTNVLFSSTVVGACLNAILNYLFILEFDTIGAALCNNDILFYGLGFKMYSGA